MDVGRGGVFPGGLSNRGVRLDQLYLNSVPRVRMGGAVPPFTLYGFMLCLGTSLPFLRKAEDSLIQ
jgi:hypothetical protein